MVLVTYGLNVDVCQSRDERFECNRGVVHAFQKHTLIADYHAVREELLSSLFCDPCNLIDMVNVRMKTDLLAQLPSLIGEIDQGVRPCIVRV